MKNINWNISIIEETNIIINKSKNIINNIINSDNKNIINDIEQEHFLRESFVNQLKLLKYASDSLEKQKISTHCIKLLIKYRKDIISNTELFQKIYNYYEDNKENLKEKEELLILVNFLKKFIINGVNLEESKNKTLQENLKKLDSLENIKKTNIKNYNKFLKINNDNLKHTPAYFKNFLIKSNDKDYRIIPLKTSIAENIICYLNNSKLRKKLHHFIGSRCIENLDIEKDIYLTKSNIAQVLDVRTYDNISHEKNIISDSNILVQLLTRLSNYIDEKYDTEIINILKIISKKKNKKINYESFRNKINHWDIHYYFNYMKKKIKLDEFKLREYFKTNNVINRILIMFQNLFSLKFKKSENQNCWHPSVKLFEIYSQSKNKLMGYFYLDIYNRKNKINNIEFLNLSSRSFDNLPCSIVIANFQQETKNNFSFVSYNQVRLFIHKFTTVIYNTLIKSKYSLNGIDQVPVDQIKIPSYLIEKIIFQKDNFKTIAIHYKTKKPIDSKTFNKINDINNIDIAYKTKLIIFNSIFYLHMISNNQTATYLKSVDKGICNIYNTYFDNIFNNQNVVIESSDYYPFLFNKKNLTCYNLINDLYASDIFIKNKNNQERMISIIQNIMVEGSSKSSKTIITDNFGLDLDLISYVQYYNIENNDYNIDIDTNTNLESTTCNKLNLTSEIITNTKIKNYFEELESEITIRTNK